MIVPDPTDNPLDRLQVFVEPSDAHITAWDLADALASGANPGDRARPRDRARLLLHGPCNLHPGQEAIVAPRLAEELERARRSNELIATSLERRRNRRYELMMTWPD